MAKHSVHLRPMEARTRRLYLLCIGSSIALILVAWIVSIHSAISGDVAQIREKLDVTLDKAGAGFRKLEDGASDYTQDFSTSLEEAKTSYEETQSQP
ncbi:hypothetical protein HZA87_00350 [Candidatus Uhrbacteria bacterium]|nr:hypothetical protein [Candidatus Uhrbacteria bacterium]